MSHKHGGNLEKIVEDYNISREKIIDFSTNTNFRGVPEDIYQLISDNLSFIEDYPEPNSKSLKKSLAKTNKLKKNNLIIGNGATEIIYQLTKHLFPKKVLVLAPTFSEYRYAAESIGAEVQNYYLEQEKDFEIDIDDLCEKIANKNFDMVFICNPNNPTGKIVERRKIEILLKNLENKDSFLVVDESFIDFVEEQSKYTAIELCNRFNNLFILRSFTKIFSIPGIRLGYGIGPKKLIGKMEANRDPWSVNSFAQLVGEEIIKKDKYIKKNRARISSEKSLLFDLLSQVKAIKPLSSKTNFILIDISRSKKSSTVITDQLAQRGIIVRDCNSFASLGEKYIRTAVKDRDSNLKLVKYLKEIV